MSGAQIPSTESATAVEQAAAVGRSARPAPPPQTTDAAVLVDTIPPEPPAELLDQIAVAGQIWDRLTSRGTTISFSQSGATVRTANGAERRLSLADVVRLASGELQLEER